MSEYGIKIKNFEASTVYECNLGVRKIPKTTKAMFSNSLFNDFLVRNGLKVTKSGATRDIICLEFNFGSRSYEEEINHINKMLENDELTEEKRSSIEKIKEEAELNKNKYDKKTKEEIRDIYYKDGVSIEYVTYKKDGVTEKKREKIHYKMLYRTPGKAKKGSCMFICDRLFKKAQKDIRMGIKLPKNNSPIVEIGAYSSLITSSICGRVRINPKNILVVEDLDSFFETKVVSVETDENKQCIAKTIDRYNLKNTMFDGQALIDHSKFPEWGNGYILLRQHFCKMAAFDTYIQKFFMDYYGYDYLTATITDMFGVEHYVKDIELITTDNAMKWLKFNISYGYWCDRVYEDGCMFGIVKTAHKSKLGDMQRMSYQMTNALDESIMDKVVANSKEYIESMKANDEVFLEYLRKNQNFSNDFEVLVALCEQNPEFTRCDYFRDRKRKVIEAYTMNFKGGRLLQNADNLVIVGSPYAMLLHAVGESPDKDITFEQEEGAIQCYTGRFDDGDELAFFRSPFNSKNNMSYLHNHYHPYFDKYFNLGEQIIAVNMRNTDFQDRNNGLTYWVTLSQAYN